MRALLIYNPTAGQEDVDPDELVSPLRAAGYKVDARSIDDEWEPALDGDHELVVVAGGDGAVTKVLKRLAGKDKVAALLPSGSANTEAHRASRIELRVPPDWPFHLDDELVSAGAERYSLKVVPGLGYWSRASVAGPQVGRSAARASPPVAAEDRVGSHAPSR